MIKQKVSKEEVIKVVNIIDNNTDPEPEVYYYLPSGYKNLVIEVYESAYEELEVRLVNKSKLDKLTDMINV